MYVVITGSNWPTSGADIARSTRGSALIGPGPISNRGGGSIGGTLMAPPYETFVSRGFRSANRSGQPVRQTGQAKPGMLAQARGSSGVPSRSTVAWISP